MGESKPVGRVKQVGLPFPGRGVRQKPGRRRPGPKTEDGRQRVARVTRPNVTVQTPVHVTLRLLRGLPSLRSPKVLQALLAAFDAAKDRFGFRLVHFSIQSNHLHLICEAVDRVALAKGMQALSVRVARAVNRLWQRYGQVFVDRYHSVILRSARQVRNTLLYVLHNARKHTGAYVRAIDTYCSGWWLRSADRWGWDRSLRVGELAARPHWTGTPIAGPISRLLSSAWRRYGPLPVDARPPITM